MRTIWNDKAGTDMEIGPVPMIAGKAWNSKHFEFEFRIGDDEFTVVHCLIRNGKFILGISCESLFDFVYDLNLIEFTGMDAAFPKSARLFKNAFAKEKDDVYVTRAIEPYSKESHWFLIFEHKIGKDIDFKKGGVADVISDNEGIAESAFNLRGVALEAIVDVLSTSTGKIIRRTFMQANKRILTGLISGVTGSFVNTPEWVEFATSVVEWGEKIEAHKNRFCVTELYNAFTE